MQEWNKNLFYKIYKKRSRFLSTFSWIASNKLFLFLFLLFWILLIIFLKHSWLFAYQLVFNLLLGTSLAYILSDYILKKIMFVKRPYLVLSNIEPLGLKETNSSTPSNHNGLVTVVLVTLCFYNPWFAFLLLLIPVEMWSRVYNGMHWPSDVILGMFLGLVIANLSYILTMSLIK